MQHSTSLIRGFCLYGKGDRAVRFPNEAMQKGFQPELVYYGTITKGFCKMGNMRVDFLLVKDMEQSGSCRPDVVYNKFIDSLGKEKSVNEALKVFYYLSSKGVTQDLDVYTSLIHGLCNFGQGKEIRGLLNEMSIISFDYVA